MYPGGNNNSNYYPYNQNYQPGQPPQNYPNQVPPQPSYPGFPNYPDSQNYPNSSGYGVPPIGFNVSQPDYRPDPGYTAPYGSAPYAPYGGNNPPQSNPQPNMGYSNYPSGALPNTGYANYPSGLPSAPTNTGYANYPPQQQQVPHPSGQSAYPAISNQGGQTWGSQAPAQQQYTQHQSQTITPIYSSGVSANIDSIGSGGERYQGTIRPSPIFNAEQDSNVLRKAMKGIGTDEKAIIECLGRRCLAQRLEIRKTFKTMFGKDLIDELKSELSGDFQRAVIESLYDQDYYDAYSLRKAMEGAGTRENVLTEILTSRSNQQIENIKLLYKKWYNRDLEKDIVSETSGFYKRVLVSCLQANKKELSKDEILRLQQNGPASVVDLNQARLEAQELLNAGEKKVGTDEACFIKIFALRNKYQLRATFEEYSKLAGRDIFSSIDREMSGDLASALKAIAMQATNSPLYFATRLFKSMKGAGTNDTTLIRVLLTRSEIDLVNIKTEFQRQFGKTLETFVKSDTSGDYQKFLMRFVEGN